MTALDNLILQRSHLPDLAIVCFRRCQRCAKVKHDSGKTARDWVASTSERKNRRLKMHRWLFEVDGGHGLTQWPCRRVEGTRPSRIDPVAAPNTARVSEKVTQEKSSSCARMIGWVVTARHGRTVGPRPRPQSTISQLAKALDRGKGQNCKTCNYNFGTKESPKGEAGNGSRKRTSAALSGPNPTFPLGLNFLGGLFVTKQHPVGLSWLGLHAGTTTIGRVRVSIGDHLQSPPPPSSPISVLGYSAAPRRHLCRLASRPSSDLQIRRRRCWGELVYKSTFDVANRRSMETRG
ncbi:hypothetical protein THAOC_29038 [Thalassiosira oceanica]|uniref:Uncharacterized protein n=1 Tax=Thalassiosira oceanica TaxID=159749 RepID=K0RDI0_THAOC|nr:hypothetical protein THAOC_29038 [Thalassiosira oceanica]|eukprot:EJK51763.1 hypothetical protein THAOC_29038 [Thalassiosira oceanica]